MLRFVSATSLLPATRSFVFLLKPARRRRADRFTCLLYQKTPKWGDISVHRVYSNGLNRAAELSQQELGVLERFTVIGNRAKDSKKPLNQQLSQKELAEFAQLQQRFQAIELQQILEPTIRATLA
jgi:hypothetical protein